MTLAAKAELFACTASNGFDAAKYRRVFPILDQSVHGTPLAYLDSAASAQKPRQVIEAMTRFYERDYANIHRGVHELSQRATKVFEGARSTVKRFINAKKADEIVFTRGATEGLNLLAHGLGKAFLKQGDEVIITELEHHANIVPWQMLAQDKGIVLKVVPVTVDHEVLASDVEKLITQRTKVISVAHISNALGTVLPVQEIIALAKAKNILTIIDGCQGICHMAVDVQALGCDFYVFSGHKLFGPSGIGVLYGRYELLDQLPPYQTGGDMIETVSFEGTTFKAPPGRFEAGTPAIAEAIGLAAAIDYISAIGMDRIAAYEKELVNYAEEQLKHINRLTFYGSRQRSSILSFNMEGVHPHDAGSIMDRCGVAVRTGHHCAEPIMHKLGISGTIRASFAFYNTKADADALVESLKKTREIFP
jgi:cysteine desulfurase/selenocysteine lyase